MSEEKREEEGSASASSSGGAPGLAQSHGATEDTEGEGTLAGAASGSGSASEAESESGSGSESESESASGSASGSASESESGSGSGSASEAEAEAEDADERGAILDARPLKKGDDYPAADERELRMAGVSCIALVLGATLTIGIVFYVAFRSINDLGGGSATATVVSEAPPRASEEERSEAVSRPEPQVDWMDPVDGLELAEEENRPIAALFEAEWADASRDMREGTFEDPSVVEALEGFVPIRVDLASESPEAIALRDEHEIRFVPHVLFLAPDGEVLRPGSAGLVAPEDLRVLLSDAREVHRARALRPPEASASDDDPPPPHPATPASDERP